LAFSKGLEVSIIKLCKLLNKTNAMLPAKIGDTTQLIAILPTLPQATASTPTPTAPNPTIAPELESQSDKIQHQIRTKLFPLEKDYPPVDVMFYYRAVEWLGELADAAQKVGSRLEVLLAK
jgi:hypothetical protein